MKKSEDHCLRCGGTMARGFVRGLRPRTEFVVSSGVPTSWNPIAAFKQGLEDQPVDETIKLDGIGALLCRTCGRLEFHAWFADPPSEP